MDAGSARSNLQGVSFEFHNVLGFFWWNDVKLTLSSPDDHRLNFESLGDGGF